MSTPLVQTLSAPRAERHAADEPARAAVRSGDAEAALAQCTTLAELFLARIRSTPDALAYQFPAADGAYGQLSWRETGERVRALAAGLRALRLTREERCAIISGTRIEWILADFAILCAGGATTTIFPSSSSDDCRHIMSDSGSVLAFVESGEQLAKLRAMRAELGALRKVVLLDGEAPGDDWVISLAELEALGRRYDDAHPSELDQVARSIEPTQLATLAYTSGTTGQPKGVRLTHDGWLYQTQAVMALGLFSERDHQYLWLPLSHSMGKVLELFALRAGFPTTVDARVSLLLENLGRVRPTFMGAPPRIFEKMYARFELAAEQAGAVERAIFRWACRVGVAVSRVKRAGGKPSPLLRAQFALLDKLVFARVRARFGGRMRFMFSGAAALPVKLAEFFHAAGLLILEGYALTETCAGAVLNRPQSFAFGTVGVANPGTEIALDVDGEILLRSRGVMQGYHKLADETRAALTHDGWLRTGDIGELSAHGYLRITDRKKDLIKTSTGLSVAPLKLERRIKAECPCITHVFVHGQDRPFCSALIEVDPELLTALLRQNQPDAAAPAPAVAALIRAAIARVNSTVAQHEMIRRFALVDRPLSVEDGLLTASMKMRRRAVAQRYRNLLDSFYQGPSPGLGPNAVPEWIATPKENVT